MFRKNILKYLLDAILSTATILIFLSYASIYFSIDFLNPLQNTFQEFYPSDFVYSRLYDYNKIPVDTNIVLINIGELDRTGIAAMLDIISKYQPKVTGIDLFFRNEKQPESDSLLELSMSKFKNLILVSKLFYNEEKDDFDSLETSHRRFIKHARLGFANFIVDNESKFRTVRSFPVFADIDSNRNYAFSIEISKCFNYNLTEKFLNYNNETSIIDFRRFSEKYRVLDVPDIFEKSDSLEFLRDKIVLIGVLGKDIHTLTAEDVFFTPMNESYFGKSLPDMYGLTVHANIISQILENRSLYEVPVLYIDIIIIIILILTMYWFALIKKRNEEIYETMSNIITIIELLVITALVFALQIYFGIIVNFKAGFIAIAFATAAYELYNASMKPLGVKILNIIKTSKGGVIPPLQSRVIPPLQNNVSE